MEDLDLESSFRWGCFCVPIGGILLFCTPKDGVWVSGSALLLCEKIRRMVVCVLLSFLFMLARETKEALPSEEVAEEHWFAPSPPEVEPSSFSTAIGQSLEQHSPTLSRNHHCLFTHCNAFFPLIRMAFVSYQWPSVA
ncbi:hypothetical protein SDJN03_16738, partial [Cucurbita argyrosperma subsp. sororia]